MKNLQGLIVSSLFVTLLSIASFPCFAESYHTPVFQTNGQISPRVDDFEWRYESFNGRLYRRLYNKTQNKWIGDWEPVG